MEDGAAIWQRGFVGGQRVDAKAAFVKVMPEVAASEQLDAVKEMTIDAVKGMAPQYFPDDKVAELDAELAKVK